jgi:hypothetical protein
MTPTELKGWFVMWTLDVDGTRLVNATEGPFRNMKEAQTHARDVISFTVYDSYCLWKNEGGEE